MSSGHIESSSYNKLFTKLLHHKTSLRALPWQTYSALFSDSFKNGIEQETIWRDGEAVAHEALSRPKDCNGKEFSIGIISEEIYALGMHFEFDVFTAANALRHATQFPLTINVSPASLLDPRYIGEIKERMDKYGYENEDVIFEILEHDVDPNTDISSLYTLKEEGFRFALDDMSNGIEDKHRLKLFGDLVDFIKIDGPLVRAYLEGSYDQKNYAGEVIRTYDSSEFEDLIEGINEVFPEKTFIAERVRTWDEAKRLTNMEFCVQGRDLKSTPAQSYSQTIDEYQLDALNL